MGVTLVAKDPLELKQIVTEMRFEMRARAMQQQVRAAHELGEIIVAAQCDIVAGAGRLKATQQRRGALGVPARPR